jgi:hypothetical protein
MQLWFAVVQSCVDAAGTAKWMVIDMRMTTESKQVLTKDALDRFEALINFPRFKRVQNDADLLEQADREFGDDLALWFERQSSRYFTRDELKLQCVVALRYADPSRPTVRELWQYLQILILKDARSLPGRRKMRFPSYSTFRTRVADLPPGLVRKTRAGRDEGRPSIASMIVRIESVTSVNQ